MPVQSSETMLSQWKRKTLTGWDEIRQALVFVDSLPEEKRNGARVEVYEYSKESSVKLSFTSLREYNFDSGSLKSMNELNLNNTRLAKIDLFILYFRFLGQ